MAIDWGGLEQKITDYLTGNSNNKDHSEQATAQFIEDAYLEAINSGAAEQYGNQIASVAVGLKDSLLSAFNASKQLKSGSATPLNTSGCLGAIQIWTGGTMQFTIPPPGAVSGVKNDVLSPGAVPPMNVQNADSGCPLAKEIVKALQAHTPSISGLLMGVDAKGNPVPGPWSGIS